MQYIYALVMLREAHLFHITVANGFPLLRTQLFPFEQAQRVVPDWLFDVRANRHGVAKLSRQAFRITGQHIAADHLPFQLPRVVQVAVKGVGHHPSEAATTGDFTHTFH
ncbi:hypothetical protein D3C84_469280 [compost metagenome]